MLSSQNVMVTFNQITVCVLLCDACFTLPSTLLHRLDSTLTISGRCPFSLATNTAGDNTCSRPDTAILMSEWPSTTEETSGIAAAKLQSGDVIKVLRGSKAPADSIIVLGASSFDESMLTGESMPVSKVCM
jgi:E1-E2 ATPase